MLTSFGHNARMLISLAMAGLFALTMWTLDEACPIADTVWP